MPTIETVSIDDVYAYEDEYGNHVLERDYTTRENARYVEELARSMRAKGVPDEPVQLARDGGIYRIVSGNSRVRAMRMLGTTRFPAVVLDDLEARDALRRAVEATVRTNTKKRYEATELSGYVQQLAMFADDEYVADAAGIEPEQVAKIRRARRVVGEDGDGYTIERMCAIAEFGDDEAALRTLTTCPEREIAYNVGRLRRAAEDAEAARGLAAVLTLLGVTGFETEPRGAIFCRYVLTEEQANDAVDGGPTSPTIAVRFGAGYRLYRMPNADDTEESARLAAEAEEREVSKAHDRAVARQCAERRAAWLEERLANWHPARLPHLQEQAVEEVSDARGLDWLHEHGIAASAGPVEIAAYVTQLDAYEYGPWGYGWGGEGARRVDEARATAFRNVYETMAEDGYQMDDEEREIVGLLEEE